MNKTNTTAEHWRLQLIAAACALQHATGTESNVIPLPGTQKYLLIGDQAALVELLEAEHPLNFPDPAPLALRTLGGLMANVLYNLAQRPGEPLTGDDVAKLDGLRKQWDEAVRVDRQAALQQMVEAGQEQNTPLLNSDELAALRRFDECAQDGEGYDVPKEMMQRLAEIGVVQRRSGAYYQVTAFGQRVLEGGAA